MKPPAKPRFTAQEGWLDKTIRIIEANAAMVDGAKRVSPMALVRCSRGGKTRAMSEIAFALKKKHPEWVILNISLNDNTLIDEWEQVDPVKALCRRIGFAALKGRDFERTSDEFQQFTKDVSPDMIKAWLSDSPSVLLVDELNKLSLFKTESPSMGGSGQVCATWLKREFLVNSGRYLVFSSHVFTTTHQLSEFMDNESERPVVIRTLPLIPCVSIAARNLGWQDLSPRTALFHGLVPSLLYEVREHRSPDRKQLECIQRLRNFVDDDQMKGLLATFLTGLSDLDKLAPLLELMSASKKGIHWIPYHMAKILTAFAPRTSFSRVLKVISDLFNSFHDAKNESGEGWEVLFVIVLLMRSVIGESHEIFHLDQSEIGCDVSYNELVTVKTSFEDIKSPQILFGSLSGPKKGPHIAVFYPSHARFVDVDVIVVFYGEDKKIKRSYGYQLKEGKKMPTKKKPNYFDTCYVILGKGTGGAGALDYEVPDEKLIKSFLGESGKCCTPTKWKKLKELPSKKEEEEEGEGEEEGGGSSFQT